MAQTKLTRLQESPENIPPEQINELIFEALGALFESSVTVKVHRLSSEPDQEDPQEMVMFPSFSEDGIYLIARVAVDQDIRVFDLIEVGGFRFEVKYIGGPIPMGPFELKDIAAKRL